MTKFQTNKQMNLFFFLLIEMFVDTSYKQFDFACLDLKICNSLLNIFMMLYLSRC